MARSAVLFLAVVAFIGAAIAAPLSQYTPESKKLAGPPSEFDLHALPSPTHDPEASHSALLRIDFTRELTADINGEILAWKGELPVDADKKFVLSLFTPHDKSIRLSLVNPKGEQIHLAQYLQRARFPLSSSDDGPEGSVFEFDASGVLGTWTFSVYWKSAALAAQSIAANAAVSNDAIVLLFNDNPIQIQSHMNSFVIARGKPVGFSARAFDAAEGRLVALDEEAVEVTMEIVPPEGAEMDMRMVRKSAVAMRTDIVDPNWEFTDGDYIADFSPELTGDYRAQVYFRGKTAEGVDFLRTTQHMFHVVADGLAVTGDADFVPSASNDDRALIRAYVTIGVDQDRSTKLRPYTQVWGKSASDESDIPICWLSHVQTVQTDATTGADYVEFDIDLRWLTLANATGPLSLRQLYVQEMSYHVPLVQSESDIPVTGSAKLSVHKLAALSRVEQPDERMLMGPRPSWLHAAARDHIASNGNGTLVLVHGYCSSTNPFAAVQDDFTNAAYFLNPDANMRNDEFAIKIAEFIKDIGATAFMAHSQGGLAILHLHNYYWSGADIHTDPNVNSEGAILQSVGSPYLGTGIAGSAAAIGAIFGVGCGANEDLTYDGAELWLTGITATTRDRLTFYTTQYASGSYCNIITQLVLSKPNDGVVEFEREQLAGAHSGGHMEGECHSAGMKYPPQCEDHSRNKIINDSAAR
eukprot:Opistho-2@49367